MAGVTGPTRLFIGGEFVDAAMLGAAEQISGTAFTAPRAVSA